MEKWQQNIKNKIDSHEYSFIHGDEFGNCQRIERELEAENYHALMQLLIRHEYTKAMQWFRINIITPN